MVVFMLGIPHGSSLWPLRISMFLRHTAYLIGAILVGDFFSSRMGMSILSLILWMINWPIYYSTTRFIQRTLQNIWQDPEELREEVLVIVSEAVPASMLVIVYVVSSAIASIEGNTNDYFLDLAKSETANKISAEVIDYIEAMEDYKQLFSDLNIGSLLPTTVIVAIFIKHTTHIEFGDIVRMRVLLAEAIALILESLITVALIFSISIDLHD
eukprot:CAMPEP_0194383786 /NCGR_PEP_ID=MMETSP0174-20130528/69748_1 /TAXON_ID=216777 /ORGANISM="Proboscia alata, Strain PI-D3" /LENGTH=212 /DNA_ID=CAMNT_0039170351 /DNA_START=176 /DNA_END=811 /DNA_ORIENTATION=+